MKFVVHETASKADHTEAGGNYVSNTRGILANNKRSAMDILPQFFILKRNE